jgi:TrpR-related protein YerC/YecD
LTKHDVLMYYHAMTKYKFDSKTKQLFNAFLKLKDVNEVANFCRDLMTEPEINEFAGRFDVAQRLEEGKSQRKTALETGVSIATVTRVNQWLTRGMDGYKTVISRLNKNHHHSLKKLASAG